MRRKRPSEHAQEPHKASEIRNGPNVPAVLPANNWVTERIDENGIRTVLPLIGWLVSADGEVRPLPLSMDATWTIRPRVEEDEKRISMTADRLRPTYQQQSGWSFYR